MFLSDANKVTILVFTGRSKVFLWLLWLKHSILFYKRGHKIKYAWKLINQLPL